MFSLVPSRIFGNEYHYNVGVVFLQFYPSLASQTPLARETKISSALDNKKRNQLSKTLYIN